MDLYNAKQRTQHVYLLKSQADILVKGNVWQHYLPLIIFNEVNELKHATKRQQPMLKRKLFCGTDKLCIDHGFNILNHCHAMLNSNVLH